MTNVEDEYMTVDPEMERIWREDDEPSFTEIRKSMNTEQPENTATAEDSEEVEEESIEETTEETSEETSVEDQSKEVEETVENKATKSDVHKVKANGMEFDFTTDELKALAPKAMDYTKKMQEIAPWRKTISALKEQGLGEQDVNMMIDALKGDKNAITEMLKRTQVDPLDLDIDSKHAYNPTQYGKDETALAIEDIVNEISGDVEYATTVKVVDEVWDAKSRQAMAKDPQMIKGLHIDIKNGMYSKIAPIAEKLKVLDGGRLSSLEYYIEAGRQYYGANPEPVKPIPVVDTKQVQVREMADKRKAASPTKSTSGKRDVIDYLDDNDEEYEAWYKRTMSSR